jgi:hypothetical protein
MKSTDESNKYTTNKQVNTSPAQKKISCIIYKKDEHIRENSWSLHKDKRPSKNKNNKVLTHIAVQTETHIHKTANKKTETDNKTIDVS